MPFDGIADFLPEAAAKEIRNSKKELVELRLRAGSPIQLIDYTRQDRFVGARLSAAQLRRIALRMMEYSYYTREEELARGYFTLKNGCRVGVSGSFTEIAPDRFQLRAIGSLCIRAAREIKGCAAKLVTEMSSKNTMQSALILSPPGMGKTTMLRDAARILSERGFQVGVADERHELAACLDGVPTMDLGPRTDVIDGCAKAQAIGMLIRSMAPNVIVTDEIGSTNDRAAVHEAARMGVAILTSAHASSIDSFEKGCLGNLVQEGLFRIVAMLGDNPGQIKEIRQYGEHI